MDCEKLSELEERLGLSHLLVQVLSAAPEPCFLAHEVTPIS